MSDVLQVAKQRRKDYEAAIAKKEAEIDELRELISDLDTFLEFGQSLVADNGPQIREVPQAKPDVQAQQDEAPADQDSLARVLASRA